MAGLPITYTANSVPLPAAPTYSVPLPAAPTYSSPPAVTSLRPANYEDATAAWASTHVPYSAPVSAPVYGTTYTAPTVPTYPAPVATPYAPAYAPYAAAAHPTYSPAPTYFRAGAPSGDRAPIYGEPYGSHPYSPATQNDPIGHGYIYGGQHAQQHYGITPPPSLQPTQPLSPAVVHNWPPFYHSSSYKSAGYRALKGIKK
eukprot:NODE_2284_length_727_cov_68.766962_g1847_i0.p1 GENE.NODE_2284_length_727_cov_68.766962_g1847_i0~~NODE_2284_length_727_cov_68.766962_g1847_i0.p1  ORF type:complete len:201 (-),score=20.85 NODE_2284_length_727_cov_68.766962_g1847_i0:69-671(-)